MTRSRTTPLQQALATIVFGALPFAGCSASSRDPHAPAQAAASQLPFSDAPTTSGAVDGGVRAILEDRHGNFWFGSHAEGVCRVVQGRVERFTKADGLSDDQVRGIYEAADGTIWFDAGVGISSFDGKRIAARTELEYPVMPSWELHPDDLWFKSHDSHGFTVSEGEAGVYRLHDGRLTYLALPLRSDQRTNTGYSVTGFAKGKGGRIWIATYDAVFGFDGASFTTIDGARMGLRASQGVPHVRCVFEDSRGRVWIGNNGVGVIVVEGDRTFGLTRPLGTGDALGRMSPPLIDSNGGDGDQSLQRVFSLGEDRDGNIWIGTIGGGAWRYDGRSLRQFTEKDGLTTASVMAIYRDRDGELWLGGSGVFRFTGDGFERVY